MNPVPDRVVEELADVTHIRPFNKDHAMAGAPFCCSTGQKVRMFLWDNPGRSPLLGGIGFFHMPHYWRDTGSRHGYCTDPLDLVMLPLGFIDGKPVFAGDKLEHHALGVSWKVFQADPRDRVFSEFVRWPVEKPALFAEWPHPKSDITVEDVKDATLKACGQALTIVASGDVPADFMCQIIGAVAIKRALDKGQVILPPDDVVDADFRDPQETDQTEIAYLNFDARKKGLRNGSGMPESERDAFKSAVARLHEASFGVANGGVVYGTLRDIERLKAQIDVANWKRDQNADRDMKIAQAVRQEAASAAYPCSNGFNETDDVRTVRTAIQALDLQRIIAAVK